MHSAYNWDMLLPHNTACWTLPLLHIHITQDCGSEGGSLPEMLPYLTRKATLTISEQLPFTVWTKMLFSWRLLQHFCVFISAVSLPEDLFSYWTGNRNFLMGTRTRTGLFLWSPMRVGLESEEDCGPRIISTWIFFFLYPWTWCTKKFKSCVQVLFYSVCTVQSECSNTSPFNDRWCMIINIYTV